ncbi:MAG: hypothetical protein H3C31_06320 [Brumimicrobium sp.]|nr:hypothetical protein [Brumimicrobium sp.]MCO5268403.1 hypothetical protein [Brumimicrobium sp.]
MKYLYALTLFTLLFACKTENHNGGDNTSDKEFIELQNKVAQLELENKHKDSVINEAISFFNEIQENLLRINLKEEEIRVKSSNPELSKEDQDWILQEIQNINFLRNENAKSIKALKNQLASQNIKIKELQSMVDRLTVDIQEKNKEINNLKIELADLNMEYAALFDEYQEQVELALDVMKEMNEVFYAYGTMNELVENNVIVREKGFIGIGKKTNVAEEFNEGYFQKLDKTKVKQLTIIGKKPEIITDHPTSSYQWDGNKLIILDPSKFWKISRYLVIVVK